MAALELGPALERAPALVWHLAADWSPCVGLAVCRGRDGWGWFGTREAGCAAGMLLASELLTVPEWVPALELVPSAASVLRPQSGCRPCSGGQNCRLDTIHILELSNDELWQ